MIEFKIEEDKDWIVSYTGKKIYVLNPTIDMIDIEDIAHSLSLKTRFQGHSHFFYSVAEHCDLMAKSFLSRSVVNYYGFDWSVNTPKERKLLAKQALLHEIGEAYLADVPRPVKPKLAGFKELEKKYEILAAEKWNLPYPMSYKVKDIDEDILKAEINFFDMASRYSGFKWFKTEKSKLNYNFRLSHPEGAKYLFMRTYNELF